MLLKQNIPKTNRGGQTEGRKEELHKNDVQSDVRKRGVGGGGSIQVPLKPQTPLKGLGPAEQNKGPDER